MTKQKQKEDLETKILATTENPPRLIILPDNEVIDGATCAKVVKRGSKEILVTGGNGKISVWDHKRYFHPIKTITITDEGERVMSCLDAMFSNGKLLIAASLFYPTGFDIVFIENNKARQIYNWGRLSTPGWDIEPRKIDKLNICVDDKRTYLIAADLEGGIHLLDELGKVIYSSNKYISFYKVPDKNLFLLESAAHYFPTAVGKGRTKGWAFFDVFEFTPTAKHPLKRIKRINSAESFPIPFQPIAFALPGMEVTDCMPFSRGSRIIWNEEKINALKLNYPVRSELADILHLPRSPLEVRVLGTGNALTKPHTTFLIKADQYYLVDHPANVDQLLKENGLSYDDIDNIIITHTHGDHLGGLQDLLLAKQNKKVNLYCTSNVYSQLFKKIETLDEGSYFLDLFDKNFAWHKSDSFTPFDNSRIKIETKHNMHGASHAIGFKFSYNGRTIGYSGDVTHLSEENLENLIKDIDENFVEYVVESFQAEYGGPFGKPPRSLNPKIPMLADYVTSIAPLRILTRYVMIDGGDKQLLQKAIRDEKAHILSKIKEQQSLHWFDDCDILFHEATIYDEKIDPGHKMHTNVKVLEANLPKHLKPKTFLVHLPEGFKEHYKGNLQLAEAGRVYRL